MMGWNGMEWDCEGEMGLDALYFIVGWGGRDTSIFFEQPRWMDGWMDGWEFVRPS